MQGVDLPELLITALFAAGCAHYFGARLAGKAREWEEKRHAIKTVEHFCNYGKMQAAAQKIAMIFHLSAFTYRNFPGIFGDWNILRTLTGARLPKQTQFSNPG